MSIIISFNPVFYETANRGILQENALRVLKMAPKEIFPISFGFKDDPIHPLVNEFGFTNFNVLERDSSITIHNNKRLPYVKEIFNYCSKIDCKIFGYINSDILMNNEVYKALNENYDAFLFSRYEIAEVNPSDFMEGKIKIIYGGDTHCGLDGFFFNNEWWIKNQASFPDDLILGESEWDTCYRIIIKKLTKRYLEKRTLYHVYHKQRWALESMGALNNNCIYQKIKNQEEK